MRKMNQQQLDDWNQTFKTGHPCLLRLDDGTEIPTRTRSWAWLTGGGHALVSVEGKAGGWDIDRLKMLETPH